MLSMRRFFLCSRVQSQFNPLRCCAFSAASAQLRSELDRAREEAADDIAWAKTPTAAAVLRQPPFLDSLDVGRIASGDALESLDAYLQARRWKHPPGPARRFLSHILTYPLTLAAGLKKAAALKETATDGIHLSVACIGARAEGSLPPSLWLETLIALPGVELLDLHLLGPEVVLPLRLPTAPGSSPGKGFGAGNGSTARMNLNVSGNKSLQVTWTRATVGATPREPEGAGSSAVDTAAGSRARAEEAMEETIRKADAFVLFNPGLGHPHLRQGWKSAAERLIISGLPIVVTCHSSKDLARDYAEIDAIGQRCLGVEWAKGRGAHILPRENAFRSLRQTEDPLGEPGEARLVSPNWGMIILMGAERKGELK